MKTIIVDDKKIEISDESYEAFKKQFVTKDKAILWKPKRGDDYWYADRYGSVQTNYYVEEVVLFDFELGNIYKTKEEAEEALKTGWVAKRKAEVEILRFIAENDLEWEWVTYESNYSIFYDIGARGFGVDCWSSVQVSILPCFKSKQDAQKVIEAMTPQLKILFGVRG